MLLALGILALGWASSSRTADMVFKKDGIPCGDCEYCLITSLDAEGGIEVRLRMDSSGRVRIPSFLIGRKGWCNIRRDGAPTLNFVEPGIQRGTTEVNFRRDGTDERNQRKLLFFTKTSSSSSHHQTSSNEETNSGEQGAHGKPPEAPQPPH